MTSPTTKLNKRWLQKDKERTLPSNRKKKTTTTKKTTANDENISPPKRKRASALKTVLQEDIVDESPLPPRAQKRKISLDSHHDLPSPKFRKVAQGEDKVQELEHQLKDLQRKYQRLRELRETEPEKLLRESLEKFKSHRDASDKLINHFKKGKGNVEIQSSVEKDDELKEKNKHDHHILRFFEDLTGIKVEYCQDFEVQTKKMVRTFLNFFVNTRPRTRKKRESKSLVGKKENIFNFFIQ